MGFVFGVAVGAGLSLFVIHKIIKGVKAFTGPEENQKSNGC